MVGTKCRKTGLRAATETGIDYQFRRMGKSAEKKTCTD